MSEMEFESNGRGFALSKFTDRNGEECSLQKSSIATEDCVWLGMREGTHHMGKCLARMHLTREHVRMLLPALQHFAETGDLPEASPSEGSTGTP